MLRSDFTVTFRVRFRVWQYRVMVDVGFKVRFRVRLQGHAGFGLDIRFWIVVNARRGKLGHYLI